MGFRLYREVLDHAPADISSGERLVWAVLADFADDATREAYPGMRRLSRRTGLTAAGVGKALSRLAARGFDLRVPVGVDKRGRAVYAREGAQSHYRIPELASRSPQSPTTEVAPESDHSASSGRPVGSEWSPAGVSVVALQGDPAPQLELKNPQQQPRARGRSAEQTVSDATGATADEAAAVVKLIGEERPNARNLPALVQKITRDGELHEWLDRVRAQRQVAEVSKAHAAARTRGECQHQVPGGAELHATSGLPLCPICRVKAEAARNGVKPATTSLRVGEALALSLRLKHAEDATRVDVLNDPRHLFQHPIDADVIDGEIA